MKTIYLAGGCFWGIEAYFKLIDGVVDTEVGYANGNMENPHYEDLKAHRANHAETIKLTYDENLLDLKAILNAYMRVIDPYAINHQGEDFGIQYRTGIYSQEEKELEFIKKYLLDKEKEYGKGHFNIEVAPLLNYYPAEEYHQDYLDKNPHGYCHINLNKYKK